MVQLSLDSPSSLPSLLLSTSLCHPAINQKLLTFPFLETSSSKQHDKKPHFLILEYLFASSLEALLFLDDFEFIWISSTDALDLYVDFTHKLFPMIMEREIPSNFCNPNKTISFPYTFCFHFWYWLDLRQVNWGTHDFSTQPCS